MIPDRTSTPPQYALSWRDLDANQHYASVTSYPAEPRWLNYLVAIVLLAAIVWMMTQFKREMVGEVGQPIDATEVIQ